MTGRTAARAAASPARLSCALLLLFSPCLLLVRADTSTPVCANQDGTANIGGYCTCTPPRHVLAEQAGGNTTVWCLEDCPKDGVTTNTRMGCRCPAPYNFHNCTEQTPGQPSKQDICTCITAPSCEIGKVVALDDPCRCPCGSNQKNNYTGSMTKNCLAVEGADCGTGAAGGGGGAPAGTPENKLGQGTSGRLGNTGLSMLLPALLAALLFAAGDEEAKL